MRKTKVAFVYDFDETLSTTYMQDYVLIPELGMKPETFWKKANQWSLDNCADQVTGSMYYFTKVAREKNIKLTKENLFCSETYSLKINQFNFKNKCCKWRYCTSTSITIS